MMNNVSGKKNWKDALKGGFCNMTAPFALHPQDKQRAKEAVRLARNEGITAEEFVQAAREYLETAKGWPFDMDKQLTNVRKYIKNKL